MHCFPVFRLIGATAVLLALAACAPTEATRGNLVDPDQIARIKTGESTQAEVTRLLGTPSARGTFDDHTWYYIGQHTEQIAFFQPDVVDRSVLVLHFAESGVVDKVETLNRKDGLDITPTGDTTVVAGREDSSWLEEMFTGIGHVTPGAGSSSRGGHTGSAP